MTSVKQLQFHVLAALVLLSAMLVAAPVMADVIKYVSDDLNRLVGMEYPRGIGIL